MSPPPFILRFRPANTGYSSSNWHNLFVLVQKSHYQTRNVKKLEAAVKVYGGMEYEAALGKLEGMLLHPFPRVRNVVVEELWVKRGVGKGVDWTKAKKGDLVRLVKG